jgi:hypothetical protein
MMRSKTKRYLQRKSPACFGTAVAAMVLEVTYNRTPEERKSAQIVHAPHLSPGAKLIKLADKLSNLNSGRKRWPMASPANASLGLRGIPPRTLTPAELQAPIRQHRFRRRRIGLDAGDSHALQSDVAGNLADVHGAGGQERFHLIKLLA